MASPWVLVPGTGYDERLSGTGLFIMQGSTHYQLRHHDSVETPERNPPPQWIVDALAGAAR